MMDRTPSYRMQAENQPQEEGVGGVHRGFQDQGRGRGGGASRGHGQVICYNSSEVRHFACDYQNPMHLSCQ